MATVVPHAALTVVKNVCPLDCPDTCSMHVTVEDGVAIGFPRAMATIASHMGFLCQKMARFPRAGV